MSSGWAGARGTNPVPRQRVCGAALVSECGRSLYSWTMNRSRCHFSKSSARVIEVLRTRLGPRFELSGLESAFTCSNPAVECQISRGLPSGAHCRCSAPPATLVLG